MHTLNNLQLNYPQDLHCTPSYAYVYNVLHVSQLIKAVHHVILWCQCYIIRTASLLLEDSQLLHYRMFLLAQACPGICIKPSITGPHT